MKRTWKTTDINYIRQNIHLKDEELAQHFGCSRDAVQWCRRVNNINKYNKLNLMKIKEQMQRRLIPLSAMTAETAFFTYQSLKAAHEGSTSIVTDPQTALEIKPVYVAVSGHISEAMAMIEATVPGCRHRAFKKEVENTDPLMFNDLKTLWQKMSRKEKEILLMAADGILNKTFTVQGN